MINYAKKAFSFALLFMMATALSAAVKFSIGDVNIVAGEKQTVTVNMENDEVVGSIQFYLTLPEGLTADLATVKVTDRLPGYQVLTKKMEDGRIRFAALAPGLDGVPAGKGGIITFEATAADNLAANTEIAFSGVKATDTKGAAEASAAEDGDVIKVEENFVLSSSVETVLLQGEDTHEIEILLDNKAFLWGLQGDLTLPAGVTLVDEKITATDRLSSFSFKTNKIDAQHYNFVAASFVSSDPAVVHINGTSGSILKFTVKGSAAVVNQSEIKLNNITSIKAGPTMVNLNSLTIVVNTIDNAADVYKKLSDEIAALQKQLDDTKTQLNTEAPGVDITEDVKAIQDQIDALKANLDEAHSAQELNQESKLDEEAVKKVTDAIADMVNKVKVATGIGAVKAAAAAGEIYTVAGQRVAAPVKGVNIINGKKVILK